MRFEKEVQINASPDEVFGYVADFTRHGEWAAHDLKIEQTSEGAVGTGSTFTSWGHQGGRTSENNLVVKEFAPGQRLVFEAMGKEGRYRHLFGA